MRHNQIAARDTYTKVDVAAVRTATAQVALLPVLDGDHAAARAPFAPTPAAPDVPPAVGKLIVASYAILLGSFGIATIASAYSVYAFAFCVITLVAYFTVPWIFFRQQPASGRTVTMESFMRDGMETLTGHCTGSAALIQMLVVPVLLTFCALSMGVAAAVFM